ncbi:MAG: proline dehydrogenase family protein [Cyclobacteriaceae bacterium]|nr:proline dehydrogenase family protein [Cyclobacteriaceae bacterium]
MEVEPKISFEDTEVAFSYKSDAELRKADFIFSLVNHPWISAVATGAVKLALNLGLPVEGIIKKTVFDHFCGGESIEKSNEAIRQLAKHGVGTILDYSVEGEETESSFDRTKDEIIHTIEKAKDSSSVPFSVFKVTGIASAAVLEKVQKKDSLTPEEQGAYDRIKARINAICLRAFECNVPVLIDAEDSWYQDPIDAIAYEMMGKYNHTRAIVFNTYQLYRTSSLKNLREAFHTAAMHNYFLGAKLVRGAYMEKERERAATFGYPDPIHPDKEATDNAFNQALAFCVDNKQRITVMCGSHNEYSNQYLAVLMEKHSMKNNDERAWFAQLYGMSDNISFNLAKAGYNVVKYVPYGPVKSVMPYLFRRAEENTSVAGQSSRELVLIKKELERRRQARLNRS